MHSAHLHVLRGVPLLHKDQTQLWIRDASQDRQPEIHSTLVREDVQNNYGADQQRLQISDLHVDKFPNPTTFACLKIRFKTEVCACSQFPTEAMLWIKELEMVESVDGLKSSCSIRGTQGPDFEVLDAKIGSRQLCLMYGTSDQEGSTGLYVQNMTYMFGSKIEDVEDRLNEFLELVRRYDEANGTDFVPDQVKKACIISNAPEPLKTHLQLNVAKLGKLQRITRGD